MKGSVQDAIDIGRLAIGLGDTIISYYKSLAYRDAATEAIEVQKTLVSMLKDEKDEGATAALYEMFIKASEEASSQQQSAVTEAKHVQARLTEIVSLIQESEALQSANGTTVLTANKNQLVDLVKYMTGDIGIQLLAAGSIVTAPVASLRDAQHKLAVLTRLNPKLSSISLNNFGVRVLKSMKISSKVMKI